MTGRVAVLHVYGGDFDLREYPVPEVEPGAILIRLTRAGICGSDLHIYHREGDPLRISRAAVSMDAA